MADQENLAQLRRRREELLGAMGEVEAMRAGSLVGRFRKCGKPTCHCAAAGERGHGPSWSLTRKVEGKTVTKIIAVTAVERTREHLAAYKRFQGFVDEFVLVCERISEAQLKTGETEAAATAKKGGSKQPSRPRSLPRSKRS